MANKRVGQTPVQSTTMAGDLIPFERSNVLMHIEKTDRDNEIFSIASDTYANWAAKKGLSQLPSGRLIFVSDKNVYLRCLTNNGFSQNGVWKNTVSAVDYYNECTFDFDNDLFKYVKDGLSNQANISVADPSAINLFNKSTNGNNTLLTGSFDFSGNLATVNNNTLLGNGQINVINGASGANVLWNTVIRGALSCTAIAGNFVGNTIINNGQPVTACLAAGITVLNCKFFAALEIVLKPSRGYQEKRVDYGYSNFDETYPVVGLTTLTFDATYDNIIGIANLTSTNATETINLFANAPIKHPFRIYPASGLTLTLTHATGAGQPICSGGVDAVINGTKAEWIEFTYNSNTSRYYETDRGAY